MTFAPKDISGVIGRVWNAAQDEVQASVVSGETVPAHALDVILVCQEAFAARDEFGRRYSDISIQRGG